MSHAFIHEAAHAVAAVNLGIALSTVSILPPGSWERRPTENDAGGVTIAYRIHQIGYVHDPWGLWNFAWREESPKSSTLSHCLPESYEGDLRIWRIGMGATWPVGAVRSR